jgi:hypothetical protein
VSLDCTPAVAGPREFALDVTFRAVPDLHNYTAWRDAPRSVADRPLAEMLGSDRMISDR